jgi:GMP synthase-like glutamine amidotransferase
MSTPGIILQHGPHAPPGHLGAYLAEAGLPHRVVRVWEEGVPDLTGAPWIASLGSEHSAADTEPAWIPQEVEALRAAADAGVPILGLCFGGQALSVALGGDVSRTPDPEIGWVAVASEDPEIPSGPYGQYHYELLAVPPGGREVARSPGGTAAFRAGPHLGLQFHPEVTREQLEVWLGMDPNLPPDFAREVAIEQGERCAPEAAERARQLFAAWFARVDGGS